MPDNILYIPIQINGGDNVPSDLLDRELFIKDGIVYVGNGEGGHQIIIGLVKDRAIITNPTIAGSLKLGEGLVMSAEEFKEKQPNLEAGSVVFIDEGQNI